MYLCENMQKVLWPNLCAIWARVRILCWSQFTICNSTMCRKIFQKEEGSPHEHKRYSISHKMCEKYHKLWSWAHRYPFHAPQLRSLNALSRFWLHAILSLIATNCQWIDAPTRVLIADHKWHLLTAIVSRSSKRTDDGVHAHTSRYTSGPSSIAAISYLDELPQPQANGAHDTALRPTPVSERQSCVLFGIGGGQVAV